MPHEAFTLGVQVVPTRTNIRKKNVSSSSIDVKNNHNDGVLISEYFRLNHDQVQFCKKKKQFFFISSVSLCTITESRRKCVCKRSTMNWLAKFRLAHSREWDEERKINKIDDKIFQIQSKFLCAFFRAFCCFFREALHIFNNVKLKYTHTHTQTHSIACPTRRRKNWQSSFSGLWKNSRAEKKIIENYSNFRMEKLI